MPRVPLTQLRSGEIFIVLVCQKAESLRNPLESYVVAQGKDSSCIAIERGIHLGGIDKINYELRL